MDKIHERIKSVLMQSGLTQSEFASKLNITQSSVSRLISGGQTPSNRTIFDICEKFNVDEIWLREGIGEMFRERSTDEELSSFFGEISFENPGFKKAFLAVLARMTEEEWQLLERKAWELAKEMEKAGPE